ncbi:hypothetical protein [Chryseosolibacter indicus]|nr:hypothetical protein [Chryseosolibacter indicus]
MYWTAQHAAVWGFYWSAESSQLLLNNRSEFINKYIKICVRYGICVPIDYLLGMSIEELVISCLKKQVDPSRWYILHSLYTKSEFKTSLFPCRMYIKQNNDLVGDFYFSVSPLIKMQRESELILDDDVNSLVKVWSYSNIDGSRKSILFYLDTDAFFSALSNHSLEDNIDNSKLAFLNATRLNSFIRDIAAVMFEFGANEMAFNNLCEADEDEHKSRYFSNYFLQVDGEILFYEDVYSLLPVKDKHKDFEVIQVGIDHTRYKKYLHSKESNL